MWELPGAALPAKHLSLIVSPPKTNGLERKRRKRTRKKIDSRGDLESF